MYALALRSRILRLVEAAVLFESDGVWWPDSFVALESTEPFFRCESCRRAETREVAELVVRILEPLSPGKSRSPLFLHARLPLMDELVQRRFNIPLLLLRCLDSDVNGSGFSRGAPS